MVNNKRIADFKQSISDTLAGGRLEFMQGILEQFEQEHDVPALEIAAALAKMSLGDRSLLLVEKKARKVKERHVEENARKPRRNENRSERGPRESNSRETNRTHRKKDQGPPEGMERFRVAVGHVHDVQPGNIVGAIANEAGLDAEHIGHINIQEDHSLVDLPMGMPKDIFRDLKKTWVCGRKLEIVRLKEGAPKSPQRENHLPAQKVKNLAPKIENRVKRGKPTTPVIDTGCLASPVSRRSSDQMEQVKSISFQNPKPFRLSLFVAASWCRGV